MDSVQTNPMETQAPEPSFDAMRLSEPVRRALDEIGYVRPTPVQFATYALAVAGKDLVVQARTGTGKTAAFGIPLVDKIVGSAPGVQALILAPTRELALQSAREVQRIGQHKDIRTVAVYGGAPMGKQIDELAAGAQIVSGTPGRVLDHLRRGTLDASGLKALVLDEMDEMLSMGFARELNAILELIPKKGQRQTLCFSATVDGEVTRIAKKHMENPEVVSLSTDAIGASEISHFVYMVGGTDRTADLVQILEAEDPETAIIFCNLRAETERVAGALKQAGFNADWLNGDLPQRDREEIMARTRQSKLRYLVATDVAARGIDISHLTHVINYSFPEATASYVHRTGRTGRAGRTGCAISLVSPQELGRLYYLRLEYKIEPIERSLPSRGELRTRLEADRISLLDQAFPAAPTAAELAMARRLLSHPESERLLAGLLRAFFGGHEALDDEAGAARRSKAPEPVRSGPASGERSRRDGGERDRGERDRGPRDRGERDRRDEPARAAAAERPGEGSSDRGRGPDRERSANGDHAPRTRTRSRERGPRPEAGSVAEAAPNEPTTPALDDESDDFSSDDAERGLAEGFERLYLSIGRKDGIRAGEIARFLREAAQLGRAEVGRIRMRDRHTLVEVPGTRMDEILSALSDKQLNDKPLGAERSRAGRT
jgi:ATP-dependent RNA helicase DeaD